MTTGKLLRTERTINTYKKSKSKYLGEVFQEVNIDIIPLEKLQEIVTSNSDDPLLYNAYALGANEINALNELLSTKIDPDFKLFEYWLECYGIYDSEEK